MDTKKLKKELLKARRCAFDSMIFIYLFEENPAYFSLVQTAFTLLEEGKIEVITSIITPIEVLSNQELDAFPEKLQLYSNFFSSLKGLYVQDLNWDLVQKAAFLRRSYNLRTPDAIQLATAIIFKAKVFVTNDDSFRKIKDFSIILLKDLL
jgi:predicted nucleic acid-binding protein